MEEIQKLPHCKNCGNKIISNKKRVEYCGKKECQKIKRRIYKVNNRERTNFWQKQDYNKNPRKYSEWNRKSRIKYKEKINEKRREYYKKNKEKCLNATKNWGIKNREKLLEYQRNWFRERRRKINEERGKIGLPRLGDLTSRECTLYLLIKNIFKKEKVYRNVRWVLDGKLELDVYIPNLKLAFEYQGKQHFNEKIMNIISRGQLTLEKQKERDLRKKDLCKKNGITLICVKYYEDITFKLLIDKLKELNEIGLYNNLNKNGNK